MDKNCVFFLAVGLQIAEQKQKSVLQLNQIFKFGTNEMAQWAKAPATKSDDLSSIPKIQSREKKQTPQDVLRPPRACHSMGTPNPHTNENKCFKKDQS